MACETLVNWPEIELVLTVVKVPILKTLDYQRILSYRFVLLYTQRRWRLFNIYGRISIDKPMQVLFVWMFFISPLIINGNLAEKSILGCMCSVLALYIYHATLYSPAKFLQKSQLINFWGFPCVQLFAFVLLLLEFFHFCHFHYDIFWCESIWVHLGCDPQCFLYLDISFLLQVLGILS